MRLLSPKSISCFDSIMPRPRKPYLHKETNRHGRTVWYVRNKDVGGKRTRIR
jgi:predicted Abi (CAAX) family protease